MSTSPTQLSLKLLRDEGYIAQTVERWNTFAGPPEGKCKECGKNKIGVRNDLFGFVDILAVHPQKRITLAVQTTTGANVGQRRRKMNGVGEVLVCMAAGWKVEIHGWSKRASGRWEVFRERLGWPEENLFSDTFSVGEPFRPPLT